MKKFLFMVMEVSYNCRGIWLDSQRGRSGEVYNLGSGNELENNQLVKIVLDHLKKPHELAEFVKDRPGHDFRYALNSTKAQEELQWQPEVDVQCGILETINWYKNNQEWVTMALRKLQGGAT